MKSFKTYSNRIKNGLKIILINTFLRLMKAPNVFTIHQIDVKYLNYLFGAVMLLSSYICFHW